LCSQAASGRLILVLEAGCAILASTNGGRIDQQRVTEVFRRLGGPEAAAVTRRDFTELTEESSADFHRVCYPLYSSKPGWAEESRQWIARSTARGVPEPTSLPATSAVLPSTSWPQRGDRQSRQRFERASGGVDTRGQGPYAQSARWVLQLVAGTLGMALAV
jgi:hypothetical protein